MPKQSPIPDALDKPYFDALNRDEFVVQNCKACNRLQHPPQPKCPACGSDANLEWKKMSGTGTIYTYAVVYDSPVSVLQADQPYNVALIQLDDDPGVTMMSHLPGRAVDDVPIGAKVKVIFETTPGTGQKVPEWQVIS